VAVSAFKQATILPNYTQIATLPGELFTINNEWAAVDSVLETARCECVAGTDTLPGECLDFWIREKMTPAQLAGDGRPADSLARLANSRAQISFDPLDATKTVVRVNSTVRVTGGDTVVYEPLPVLSAPGTAGTSWVVSTQTADSTVTLQFHLLNPACRTVTTLPCVAINGTAVITRLPSGGSSWSVNRDAFPNLAYFSRTGTTGCVFSTNFVAEARSAPFNLDFVNLLPFMPNQIIDGEKPELDNPCNISEV
jgi:hypothetical protein